jgi:hypothetical protein
VEGYAPPSVRPRVYTCVSYPSTPLRVSSALNLPAFTPSFRRLQHKDHAKGCGNSRTRVLPSLVTWTTTSSAEVVDARRARCTSALRVQPSGSVWMRLSQNLRFCKVGSSRVGRRRPGSRSFEDEGPCACAEGEVSNGSRPPKGGGDGAPRRGGRNAGGWRGSARGETGEREK